MDPGVSRCRELLLALPEEFEDLYRVHQVVWEQVALAAQGSRRAPRFIFRQEGALVRVRSEDFTSRSVSRAWWRDDAPCRIDMAAIMRNNGSERPVPQDTLAQWCEDRLVQAGFIVKDLQVAPVWRHGLKHERGTGRQHDIGLQVAQVTARLGVADRTLATQAWVHGIGRGKRFGLGMIAQ